MHQRLLQSATTPFSTGLEKSRRFRTKGGLNEHLERHESGTGPFKKELPDSGLAESNREYRIFYRDRALSAAQEHEIDQLLHLRLLLEPIIRRRSSNGQSGLGAAIRCKCAFSRVLEILLILWAGSRPSTLKSSAGATKVGFEPTSKDASTHSNRLNFVFVLPKNKTR
ncbi:MAG: hypothetical protein ACI9KK_003273 [Ascidiaceihabitans sp.]